MTPTDYLILAGFLVVLPVFCGVAAWLSCRYFDRHTREANEQWAEAITARELAMSQHADALAAHEATLQSWESRLMHRELDLKARAHDTQVLIDATLDEITEINWSVPD